MGYDNLPMVARSKNVTISSSDAGKLLPSADPKVLGSRTLTAATTVSNLERGSRYL